MAHSETAPDPRWKFLEDARPELLRAFGPRGVVRIEFVAAFPELDDFAVWLCTNTDDERDRLGLDNPLRDAVRAILLKTAFSAEQLHGLMTTAQSQETVDRDCEGSWFYALR